ncbi:eukaryotic translation initiation factor 2-alpha kinase 3 [Galendromus occidentalis]|uniref:non-specific serine/threonine protein kinase n=1 Tax=Galendromus occidentalis TaxID=34638 RepID=A0AAJ6QM71_9ACAR|nr:eukaryotic translation initiation factor 2-alpha kinase 3 [Galendromus occidentalis]
MLRCFLLTALLLVMPASTIQSAGFGSNDPQLPDCSVVLNSAVSHDVASDLVLLSTLDGKVTAVDSLGGGIIWQFESGPALLSSSPKTLFLENSRGETATCIPSLDGSLYVFDGKNIQLFVTAELLLRNSLKTGQSVLTGGTEIKTFGLDPRTGQVRYICSTDGGCLNLTDSDGKVGTPGDADDVVVIRRHSQTVRAIEPRSGTERWHFSVAENEVQYVPETSTCGRKASHESHHSRKGETVRILASKGLVTSSKRNSNDINWEIRLSAPVVGAWKLENSRLQQIDLFEPANIIGMDENGPKPFLHLGVYQQQLYMHQNQKGGGESPPSIDTYVRLMLEHSMSQKSQNALTPVSEGASTDLIPQMLQTLSDNEEFDTGIYFVQDEVDDGCTPQLLPPSPAPSQKIEGIDSSTLENISGGELKLEGNSEEVNIIYGVYSMWHYWKEICVLCVVVSVATNLFLSKLLMRFGIKLPAALLPRAPSTTQISDATGTTTLTNSSKTFTGGADETQIQKADAVTPDSHNQGNYVSRFATDFEPVRCLGKGGFGIVFESRNRIDDCSYAIKRIRLPSKQAAREKVLREVKALAKLDHPHIVRYYNAWLETPPPGWQETVDDAWKSTLPLSSSNALSNDVGTVATVATESIAETANPLKAASVNPLKPFDDLFDERETNKISCVTEDIGSLSGSWYSSDREEEPDDSEGCEYDLCRTPATCEDSIVFQSSSGDHSIVFDSRRTWFQKGLNGFLRSRTPRDLSVRRRLPRRRGSESGDGNSTQPAVPKRPSCLQLEEAPSTQPVYLYIQMQLCRKESLKEWLSHRTTLDHRGHDKILDIFFQISSAVEYVHDKGLIHRDLKPSNIFFATADDVIKVGDFGLVTGTDNNPTPGFTPAQANESLMSFDGNFNDLQLTDKVGTQLYMSPEQITGNKYNQKVDIFSLGLIFFELLWSLPTQMERVNTLTAIKQLHFPRAFKKSFPIEYQLVRQMVAADPTNRPSALEVRKNSLFDEFRQELPPAGRRRTLSTRTSVGSQDSSQSTAQHQS